MQYLAYIGDSCILYLLLTASITRCNSPYNLYLNGVGRQVLGEWHRVELTYIAGYIPGLQRLHKVEISSNLCSDCNNLLKTLQIAHQDCKIYYVCYSSVSVKPKVFVSQILRHNLTKEARVRKFFNYLNGIKKPCFRKFERLTRSKILEIL